MRNFLLILLILVVSYLIFNAMVQGIQYGSAWGVAMACASLVAFLMCIRLYRKLRHLKKMEQEENEMRAE